MRDPEDMFKVATLAVMILMLLVIIPKAMQTLNKVRNGVDDESLEIYNLTVISKRMEFERGFLSLKKTYVLILSDGKSYKVNREIFGMYQTGDKISIELKNGKVVFS